MELLQGLMDAYPTLTKVLAIMGTLRLFLKPLFTAIHSYIKSTPSVDDDAFLNKIESNKIYKWALYVLDWLTSVKVKP
jgi:hypothetical protein